VNRLRFALTALLVALAAGVAFAYSLGPGDQLKIEIRGEQTAQSIEATVSVDGRVYVDPAGAFTAEGKAPAQLEAEIATALDKYLVGPIQVTVLVAEPKELPISVLGQVRQPGDLRIPDDRPLLSTAISKAGGLLAQASWRRVSLVREGREIGPIDLYAVLKLGRSDQDLPLRTGDVIYVPARERWVTVIGPAESPGVYELLPGDRLSNLIVMAGGLTAAADERRAVIERSEADGKTSLLKVNIEAALARPGSDADPLLAHGDTVRLAVRVGQVYVVGEVAQPGPQDFQDNRSLLDYIGLSGGLTNRAVAGSAGVIRPGNPEPKVMPVDLGAYMQGRAKGPPPAIEPGDIIVVPQKRIATVQDWGSLGQVLTGVVAAFKIF
jgi:polysaccharide export outer membrane protein